MENNAVKKRQYIGLTEEENIERERLIEHKKNTRRWLSQLELDLKIFLMRETHAPTKTMYNMENFKNIILLLTNSETRELGATLVVSQGLEKKVLALYERKRKAKKGLRFFKMATNKQSLASINNLLCKANRNCKKIKSFMSIIISIRDAMHDKEVFELVEAGKMKESERLPF